MPLASGLEFGMDELAARTFPTACGHAPTGALGDFPRPRADWLELVRGP